MSHAGSHYRHEEIADALALAGSEKTPEAQPEIAPVPKAFDAEPANLGEVEPAEIDDLDLPARQRPTLDIDTIAFHYDAQVPTPHPHIPIQKCASSQEQQRPGLVHCAMLVHGESTDNRR